MKGGINKVEVAIVNGFRVSPTHRNGSVFFDVTMANGQVVKGKKGITPSRATKGKQKGHNVQEQMKIIYTYLYDKYIK